jgi:outer membrane receptor protein involved in Fe transport
VGALTGLGNDNTQPTTANSTFFTFSDDVAWTRGRHFLKMGALVERLRTEKLTSTGIRGSYTFLNLQQFLAGVANRFSGVLPGAELNRTRVNWVFAGYFQDDLRVSDRITLNLGLRYEAYTVPADINGIDTALHDIFTDTDFTGALRSSTRRRRTGDRVWDSHGMRPATGARRCAAARACTTIPTGPSTARSASRRSRRRSARRSR